MSVWPRALRENVKITNHKFCFSYQNYAYQILNRFLPEIPIIVYIHLADIHYFLLPWQVKVVINFQQ